MRLPVGLWIWLNETRAALLVAENTWTGIETSASRIWPCQYARAAIFIFSLGPGVDGLSEVKRQPAKPVPAFPASLRRARLTDKYLRRLCVSVPSPFASSA